MTSPSACMIMTLVLLTFSFGLVSSIGPIPRLRSFVRNQYHTRPDTSLQFNYKDFQTFYYPQTLDHFNYHPYSYATFNQCYVVNSKYWAGANSGAPIFALLGAEAPIDKDFPFVGFLTENAPDFKALLVSLEHRFYGESIPFGMKLEDAIKNDSMRGYFNSAQALADYAELLLHLKKKFSAENSPIIVFGGSYGGMLASWFRLKYPHITLGALASSAPILYFDNLTPQNGYYSIVTNDFKESSPSCEQTIRASWDEIDRIGLRPDGLTILSRIFKTCKMLTQTSELKDYLAQMYCDMAQYYEQRRHDFCEGVDGAPKDRNILEKIMAGLVSSKNKTCYHMDTNSQQPPSETDVGYAWQMCSEMVMPMGSGVNDTMFPAEPFNITLYMEECKSSYGVVPRPHWITTYYGGQNIKEVLSKFGSNIIFSNGLRDPYSSGGVLENISDTILAVNTVNGSHCLDINDSSEDDPKWLKDQRKKELKIIKGWLTKYYTNNI